MPEESEKIYAEDWIPKSIDIGKWRKWRRYWFDAGPIRLAEEYLFCPPNVPPYPNWQQYQKEEYCIGCQKVHKKFHDNGVPVHIILSEDQKVILMDAWKNGIRLIILSAGRGCGKTFILAVWNVWRLCTKLDYEITCMGGSAEQSKIIQKYIDYWRRNHDEVGYIINKSPKAIGARSCKTRLNGECRFSPCSPTAAMGPHVDEVQMDEVCAAESKGIEGQEAIEAVDWQVTGRRDTYVWMTSTSHFLLGKFYEMLMSPERFGFKAYFWSIAKHISGKPAKLVYEDRNPKHWVPAVWWITQSDVEKLRKRKSNEEWLCWALGQPSLASGAIFKRTDLDIIFCNQCSLEGKDCLPYKWGHCKLIQQFGLGDEQDSIMNVTDRKGGFDYGDPAPCSFGIGGLKGDMIFILYADEQKGLGSNEVINWLDNKLIAYKAMTVNPDPSIGGKHISEALENKGYAINILEEGAKEERVQILKSIVERHKMIIPIAFWALVNSLKKVHRDRNGRIRKYEDHSFDMLCYMCCDWGELQGSIGDFFDVVEKWVGRKIKTEERNDSDENIIFSEKTKGIKFWSD